VRTSIFVLNIPNIDKIMYILLIAELFLIRYSRHCEYHSGAYPKTWVGPTFQFGLKSKKNYNKAQMFYEKMKIWVGY